MKQESQKCPAFRKTGVLLVLAALGAGSLGALAQGQANARVETEQIALAELEQAYWVCDYASTMTRLDMGTAMSCSVIIETLKRRKFDGNFEAMLVWWRENKEAQHSALDKQLHASAIR
jgi:hypothetical protein